MLRRLYQNIANAFSTAFMRALKQTYPLTGVDPVHQRFYGCKETYERLLENGLLYTPFNLLTSFLGLPNYPRNYQRENHWRDIFENVFLWKNERDKRLNILLAIFMLPIRIFTLPVHFLTNIIKLVTEVLPFTLHKSSKILFRTFENSDWSNAFFVGITTYALLFLSGLIFKAVYFTGCAITSPMRNTRQAAKNGYHADGYRGWLLRGGGSAFFTMALYAVLMPFAIQAAAFLMAPLGKLMPKMAHVAMSVIKDVLGLFKEFGEGLNFLFHLDYPLLRGLGLAAFPEAIGFGGSVGLVITTVAVAVQKYLVRPFQQIFFPPVNVIETDKNNDSAKEEFELSTFKIARRLGNVSPQEKRKPVAVYEGKTVEMKMPEQKPERLLEDGPRLERSCSFGR